MPQQIDLNPIQYQAPQTRPVDSTGIVQSLGQAVDTAAFVVEQSAFKSLQNNVAKLEQDYQAEKQADAQAFADVRAKLADGQADADVAGLQAQAVKLAAKLRQGGNSLDYVTKLQLATKQAKMRAPWAADKLEATFQKYVGSEGSSMIYTDYQASQKMQQQYQQQLLADAGEMGLHPADPFLEEKVLQAKAEAFKLKRETQQLQALGAKDEVMSRPIINNALTSIDNSIESVVSGLREQYGDLNNIPQNERAGYLQQIIQLQANARLQMENAATRNGLLKIDKEHLNNSVNALNSKAELLKGIISGKVSADILKDGLSIAENGVLINMSQDRPDLFNVFTLMKEVKDPTFSSQALNNKKVKQFVEYMDGIYSKDPADLSQNVQMSTSVLKNSKIDQQSHDKVADAVIQALEAGVKSPSLMSAEDRDNLISTYKNPRTKAYFDQHPEAVRVLEEAVLYKTHKEIPTALKKQYSTAELQSVQANVSANGQVNFVPLQGGGISFDKARDIASQLNRVIAPNINTTVRTWHAYTSQQGRTKVNPYEGLVKVMPVSGVESVTFEAPKTGQLPTTSEPSQPGVRRVIRREDGSLGFE
jgi:hypothetical protein